MGTDENEGQSPVIHYASYCAGDGVHLYMIVDRKDFISHNGCIHDWALVQAPAQARSS
jgi:hypothetical protein